MEVRTCAEALSKQRGEPVIAATNPASAPVLSPDFLQVDMPELEGQPDLKLFYLQFTTDPRFSSLQQMLAKHVK
eukprot:8157351-Pyramimonas_sp.AAC.1